MPQLPDAGSADSGELVASLPLVERELRVALRKLNPRRRRLLTAFAAISIIIFLLLAVSVAEGRHSGGLVHAILLFFGLLTLRSVPGRVAGAIAGERRNGTLGILIVSGLSSTDIFVGKLFSAVLITFNDLLAIFPLLALPFIMGGVSFEVFIATLCCLPNLLFFVLAVSLFASTVTKEEASAQTWTNVILLAVCGVAPAIWVSQQWFAATATQSFWLTLSPAYGVFLVFSKFGAASAQLFWINSLVTLGWSVLFLLGAAGLLQRIWRSDEVSVPVQSSQVQSRWRFINKFFDRQRAASRWMLECNPALWQELADTNPLKLVWLSIGALVGIWLLGWALWPAQWAGPANFFLTATVLITIVRTIQNHATAKRFAVARRDGAFELVLTTPLSAAEVVEGHLEGRQVQFKPVVRFLFLLELFMALAGLMMRQWTEPALFTYFCLWAVLAMWTWNLRGGNASSVRVAWTALNSAQVTYAMKGNKIGWWWLLWCVWNIFRGLAGDGFPSGSGVEVVIAVMIAFVACMFTMIRHREAQAQLTRMITEFREIIREPIPDPHDPRYAHWLHWTQRFPWGWAGFQDQVVERNARRRAEQARRR